MGLLDVGFPLGGGSAFTRDDFKDGLQLQELVPDGIGLLAVLVGRMIPIGVFEVSGDMNFQQDYYPGSDEPVIQILGAREDDIPLKGTIKDQNFPVAAGEQFLAESIIDILNDMRKRGNLIKMTLGEFVRYGIISRFKYEMKDRHEFDYEMMFTFVSHEAPTKCPIIEDKLSIPSENNQALLSLAADLASSQSSIPSEFPVSIGFVINKAIGEIASAINVVTDFIDGIVAAGEGITASINRAVGVPRAAKTSIVKNIITLGKINHDLHFAAESAGSITAPISTPFEKPPASVPLSYKGAAFVQDQQTTGYDALSFIRLIENRFANLRLSLPKARYLVKDGDTLQKIAIKFYSDADQWEKIYDHNNLNSFDLVRSTVLEIPRLS